MTEAAMNLVERLRDMHALAGDACDPEYNRALLEAADRIEQLEDDLQDCQSRAITDLRYRIEVLEAALREIDRVAMAHTRGGIGPFDNHTDKGGLQDMLKTVCRGFNLESR